MTEKSQPDFSIPMHRSPFRIEDTLVLPALNRVERGQETQQIEPRIMQVLLCLAARPNEVISRQTLFDVVWADSVVCEEALTRAISELRRVFHDDSKTPRIIETIRKGGYRLIVPVTPASAPRLVPLPQASASALSSLTSQTPQPAPPPTPLPAHEPAPPLPAPRAIVLERSSWIVRSLRRRNGIFAVAVLALLTLSAWELKRLAGPSHSLPVPTEARPLTSYPGLEIFPALSPDGSMIAFSWAGESPGEGSSLDIYVMKASKGSPVRLTTLPGCEYFPSWSPDGTEIAFANVKESESAVCTVPVLGGSVRRMASIEYPVLGMDWSPDGQTIAYSARSESSAVLRIHLLSLATLARRDLTSPPQQCQGDIDPAFSPDGRSVAFIRVNELQEQDAYCVSTDDGQTRRLDMAGERVSGVSWLSPSEMIVSAASRMNHGLWRVSVDANKRTQLAVPGGLVQRPSKARNGPRLAYEKVSYARDIWCLEVSAARTLRQRQQPLIASTLSDSDPAFSPDGRSIGFVSDRSGSPEIWIVDDAGGDPRQLTDHGAKQMSRPQWSPDGREVAYSCDTNGSGSIYVTEVESHVARIVRRGGPCSLSCWSRQGDALFFQVEAGDGWEVWRIHPDGSAPTRIGDAGMTVIDGSADGRSLLCLKAGEPGIWLLPVEGGERSPMIPGDLCSAWTEITPVEEGMYYIRPGVTSSTLGFYDYATARADSLASIELTAASLAVSPDRSMILYDSIGKIEVDLMIMDLPE